ncbi:hypothetical protein [Fulvivirga ligni]|uniref:hypothetical protein n=1 Tax=Fulvivirga ligni TaxID=2904246 RepID=UPI001F1C6524|nr:hypothetical protein [Fulvivirga ligni]UII19568.1 hypothetical protein LVD16_17145 [Fulvivirga ligni]
MKTLKLAFGIVAAFVICYFALTIFMIFSGDIENYTSRTEFNSEAWKKWEETETNQSLRWDMAHSLTTNYELKGMTTGEIIELLGIPSEQSISKMCYYLGMARHGIDTGFLDLEIKNGVVVNYTVWQG